MIALLRDLAGKFEKFAGDKFPPLADLAMRLVIVRVFLSSGISKLKDQSGTADLFQYEWFSDENWLMQLIGIEEMPRFLAVIMSVFSTAGEIILPILLIVGLFTRFAAAGLMGLTAVIVIFVYPLWTKDGLAYWWSDHVWWVVILFALMAFGANRFSIDYWRKTDK